MGLMDAISDFSTVLGLGQQLESIFSPDSGVLTANDIAVLEQMEFRAFTIHEFVSERCSCRWAPAGLLSPQACSSRSC